MHCPWRRFLGHGILEGYQTGKLYNPNRRDVPSSLLVIRMAQGRVVKQQNRPDIACRI